MAQLCLMTNETVTATLARASFTIFLSALPYSNSLQSCFMSPLGIIFALTLGLNGAGPDSTTQLELLRAVSGQDGQVLSEKVVNLELGRTMGLLNGQCTEGAGSGTSGNTASQFVLANSVWTSKGVDIKPEYQDAMKTLYQATARQAVHGAKDVNRWISDVTHGMINDLVETDDFDAILANAIYFRGLWTNPFEPRKTQERKFHTLRGEIKMLDMMEHTYGPTDGVQVATKENKYIAVSLPYSGNVFRAVVLLPAIRADMWSAINEWASTPRVFETPSEMRVLLPKFTVKFRVSLVPVLKSMGVQAAFYRSANFSRMSNARVRISSLVHEAFVEVDEVGTEAVAATAAMLQTTSKPKLARPAEVIFDRPFVFMIYHNPTNLPIFIGIVHDPSATSY